MVFKRAYLFQVSKVDLIFENATKIDNKTKKKLIGGSNVYKLIFKQLKK